MTAVLGVASLMAVSLLTVEAPFGFLPLSLTAIVAPSARLNWSAGLLLGATLSLQMFAASWYGVGAGCIWVVLAQMLSLILAGATLGAVKSGAQGAIVIGAWLISITASLLMVAMAHAGV